MMKQQPQNKTRSRKRINARGAAALEIALLLPVVVLVASAATAIWRIWWSEQQLAASAAAAVRAASQAETATAAEVLARAVITADMATARVHCGSLSVSMNVVEAAAAPGVGGRVSVTVSCQVGLSDLLVPGLPGAVTLRTQAIEIVDTFVRRAR
jgi:uncharacterized protein (UPF0333 family)